MEEIDEILNSVLESSTQTETPEVHEDPEVPEVESSEETESSAQTETPETPDKDTETLSDDQRDVEKEINTDPVFEEDNLEYLMSKETADALLSFGERYLNLMLQKKQIAQDIKALKQEFAEQGTSVNAAIRTLNSINSEHKKSEFEIHELEVFKEFFKKSKVIMDKISDLNAKD